MSLEALPLAAGVPSVTARGMAEADRVASEEYGIPLEALMENAAHRIARATRLFLGGTAGRRVVAIAGSGHNGGDALAALRHLAAWGADVRALLTAPRAKLRPLAGLQHDILVKLGITIEQAADLKADDLERRLGRADAVLDGLLGYSARGAPRGEVARVIAAAGASATRVIAVDLPSGLDPDTGEPMGAGAVTAALTVTLALPKAGLLREGARHHTGMIVLADIGIPARAYERLGIDARGVFRDGDLVRLPDG